MTTIKTFATALGATLGLLGAGYAQAQTVLKVHYPMPGFFKDVMADISQAFMRENPDVSIEFVAPSPTYEDGLQLLLRQANSANQPDISFVGFNRLRVIDERGLAVDLTPFIAEEADIAAEGFSPRLLDLAKVGDHQLGLAFAASTPIMYYNADLLREVGGDPENPPDTWDEVIEYGGRIAALGNGVQGIDFRWQGDDWMFMALVLGDGGRMMSEDEKSVAFAGPEGQAALELIERMRREGGMPVFTKAAGEQAFVSGKVGFAFQTTGALRNTINNVGDKFDLRTAPLPLLDAERGKLPTGGNAIVMLTRDPAKQQAAWRLMKFAAGPYGAATVVPGTGYVPTNTLAAQSPDYLGDFYPANPLFQAGLDQMDAMVPWYAFPGANGVRITQAIVDRLAALVELRATPAETLDGMRADVERLLPRR
ncbi:ABC transporter substrate-binding protein [Halotalea alkalilenta]|uniref:ABC transporter substrate-binding protein n=1 Tax=Halotalea alkalilenta TaxID=376489 RepID=UPI000694055D|nr:ABC transporter substrate-binding protein [Halotalea alkalilenta]